MYLLLWLVFHVLHLTARAIFPGYSEVDVYGNVVKGFSNPIVVAGYVVAMFWLGLHLYHGTWSAAQTLGWTDTARARATAKATAHLIAAVVAIGFAIPPLAILFGIVKGN